RQLGPILSYPTASSVRPAISPRTSPPLPIRHVWVDSIGQTVKILPEGGTSMAESDDVTFAGSVPALYDRYLGPVLFEPYAADLARRISPMVQGSVLETAAGTGVVTRRLATELDQAVRIVATDLNQPMLDHARNKPGMERV